MSLLRALFAKLLKRKPLNTDKSISFNYHQAFDPKCELSQFVTILSQIHSNLTLSLAYMTDKRLKSSPAHPDSYMYFLSTLLAHTREAVSVISDWCEQNEIKDFVARNELGDLLEKVSMSKEEFEKSCVSSFLLPLRHKIFHYTKHSKREFLEEVIAGVSKDRHEFKLLPDDMIGSIHVSYSKEVISGIISKGTYDEESFLKVLDPTNEIISNITNFCSVSIGRFLSEKGVNFSSLYEEVRSCDTQSTPEGEQ